MQKIVVNRWYIGLDLSLAAVRRWAELNGRKCYAYTGGYGFPYVSMPDNSEEHTFHCFDAPLPNGVVDKIPAEWHKDHYINYHNIPRNDPKLVQVVKELGPAANGRHAKLVVVEIPDDIEWGISEYDGSEQIEEKHRTW